MDRKIAAAVVEVDSGEGDEAVVGDNGGRRMNIVDVVLENRSPGLGPECVNATAIFHKLQHGVDAVAEHLIVLQVGQGVGKSPSNADTCIREVSQLVIGDV